jgi:hypothetical protein
MLQTVMKSLFIKGSEDAHVVMCSNSETFELKEAETSNSLLVMPSLNHGKLIEATDSRSLKKQEVCSLFLKFILCIK